MPSVSFVHLANFLSLVNTLFSRIDNTHEITLSLLFDLASQDSRDVFNGPMTGLPFIGENLVDD